MWQRTLPVGYRPHRPLLKRFGGFRQPCFPPLATSRPGCVLPLPDPVEVGCGSHSPVPDTDRCPTSPACLGTWCGADQPDPLIHCLHMTQRAEARQPINHGTASGHWRGYKHTVDPHCTTDARNPWNYSLWTIPASMGRAPQDGSRHTFRAQRRNDDGAANTAISGRKAFPCEFIVLSYAALDSTLCWKHRGAN